jgi:cytoskeleton protein RodZ
MTGPTKDEGVFDERAALAELERFRRDIERYRAEREGIGQKFDRYIESLPAPHDVFPSEATLAPRPTEPRPAPVLETIALPPLPKRAAAPPVIAAARPTQSVPAARDDERDAGSRAVMPPARTNRTPIFVSVIAILLAVGVFATWTFRRGTETTPQPATQAPVTEPAAQPSAPQAAPAAVAVTGSEISTVRRAWVRVIADGERIVEREVPANTRVPFTAEKTIIVRTGDAGAVKLSIRGEDQGALGRDGEVVTRTFTVPAAAKR